MKTIEINDDLYEFLLKNAGVIGETATEILNRLLGRPGEGEHTSTRSNDPNPRKRGLETRETELTECLRSPKFLAKKDTVGRFLQLLSCAHDRDPEGFKQVLAVAGRSRTYFATTRQELTQAGKSVQPRRVPETSYWVVTNNDTPKKARMLKDVLRVLGYSQAAIDEAVRAIRQSP